ncbi:hypothetical protein NIZ92_11660 [Alcaligenes sp. 1735tsa3]|uniref:hypothetical protein n=1 Tax=Alcaligenes sp. 1735tsa3 TaxID=2953809 RepID=UPI0020A75405|nr:hypothetical protein [Alcaligenes sp. 1735tsa3]USY23978.1 hypothetical protein NIZ92_11660 [Alcaligenes sp. 1735tsa3]
MRIKLKEDYSVSVQRAWGVGVGIVAGLLIGVPIGWGATLYPTDSSFILALLTAIGTIGSAVGAVGIAGWQFKQRREELYGDAIQVAAASHLRLGAIAGDLERGLGIICETLLREDVSGGYLVTTITVHAAVLAPSFPDARRLIPISSYMSAKLATAEAELDLLARTVDRIRNTYVAGDWQDLNERKRHADVLHRSMARLVKMIKEVASDCLEAVSAFDKCKPRT